MAKISLSYFGISSDPDTETWEWQCFVCGVGDVGHYTAVRDSFFSHEHDRLRLIAWNFGISIDYTAAVTEPPNGAGQQQVLDVQWLIYELMKAQGAYE